jgi:hypothetical protein
MKIKVLKSAAVYEEKELTFPFYRCQHDLIYYKVISEALVISVKISKFSYTTSIGTEILCVDNVFHEDSKEITQEEFLAAYTKATIKLADTLIR